MTAPPGPDERRRALEELAALTQELGPDVVAVCTVHMRFVPCRKAEGCVISEDPSDVAAVTAWQRGGRGQA